MAAHRLLTMVIETKHALKVLFIAPLNYIDKWRGNCLIDEVSNFIHVINILQIAIYLSFKRQSEMQRKEGKPIVMKAPHWPSCDVKYWVSSSRSCYLMACREAIGTM